MIQKIILIHLDNFHPTSTAIMAYSDKISHRHCFTYLLPLTRYHQYIQHVPPIAMYVGTTMHTYCAQIDFLSNR